MLKNRKLFIKLISLIVCLTMLSASCSCSTTNLVEIECFTCAITDEYVTIDSFSQLGKEQRYIVVPEKIEGKRVANLGTSFFYNRSFFSGEVKKLYIKPCLDQIDGVFNYSEDLSGIFCIQYPQKMYIDTRANIYFTLATYISKIDSNYCNGDIIKMRLYVTWADDGVKLPANVGYIYNYENAPNDNYYWIDDYNGTTIEYIPEEPIREGYTFGGWYKEPECINPWNFETDIIPKKIVEDFPESTDKGYKYQETRLYAKWIKS